jgi:hypothetical protein
LWIDSRCGGNATMKHLTHVKHLATTPGKVFIDTKQAGLWFAFLRWTSATCF